MKKKVSVLSIVMLVFVAIMIALFFVPITKDKHEEVVSIYNYFLYSFRALSVISIWYMLYPVCAIIFSIFIVINSLKNIKASKGEQIVKVSYTKCLWILLILGILGWFFAFLELGSGDGDMPGILKAAIFYLVPTIILMVLNKNLKKIGNSLKEENK